MSRATDPKVPDASSPSSDDGDSAATIAPPSLDGDDGDRGGAAEPANGTGSGDDDGLSLFHRAFDKLYPVIRVYHERLRRNPWFSPVAPQLWLGGAPTEHRDYQFILENGINAVLDIRAERSDDVALYFRHGITYKRVKVPDIGVPDVAAIEEGVTWVDEQIDAGRTVLIHCAKGRGRSATLAAAYLMRHADLSFEAARELLVSRRRLTKLEDRHRRRLEEWAAGDGSRWTAGEGAPEA